MVDLATDAYAHGSAVAGDSDERALGVPGRLAAATWAVGLVIGLTAMAAGHELLAGISLSLAILSPWVGLAWVAHNQRFGARRVAAVEVASYAGGWPPCNPSR